MGNTRSSNGGNRPRHRMNRRQREELMRKRKIATAVILMVIIIAAAGIIWGIVALVRHSRGGSDKPQHNSQVTQTAQSGQNETQAAGSVTQTMTADTVAHTTDDVTRVTPPADMTESSEGTAVPQKTASVADVPSVTSAVTASAAHSEDENTDRTFTTSKGFTGYVKDGVTYIDGYLLVNKTYSLPSTYVPQNPDVPVTASWSTTSLDKDLMDAWRTMKQDADALGLNLVLSSGYRSYSTQVTLYNRYVAQDGKAAADTYSARAGYSEHQSGLCFDLNSIEDSFQYTDEGKWVNDNAYKYGFTIRFPKGKESYTGYQYESWHLRYVGKDLAQKLYNNGDWLSLEEYFGVTSEYKD